MIRLLAIAVVGYTLLCVETLRSDVEQEAKMWQFLAVLSDGELSVCRSMLPREQR
jgi:hypothetical protein